MSEQLKRCPFCGGDAVLVKGGYGLFNPVPHDFAVKCTDCGASTMRFSASEKGAIEAWNRRASE